MAHEIANVDMAAAWDGDEGAEWARDWEHYDRGFHGYHDRLLEAATIVDGVYVGSAAWLVTARRPG